MREKSGKIRANERHIKNRQNSQTRQKHCPNTTPPSSSPQFQSFIDSIHTCNRNRKPIFSNQFNFGGSFVFLTPMENRERKKKNRVVIGGGGDVGAVVLWGGAMAVAGVVAAFAVKRRFGWWRKDSKEIKKSEEEKNGELEKAKVIDSMLNVKKIDSVDFVSALLGEKPKDKDDIAKQRPTAPHQDIVPIINYAIPAIPAHPEIVDPYTTLNPDIQEIIPLAKLKPEFIAGIVEECKSLVIDKVDPPVPLKDAKGPVERLILKPIISQATLEAEPLLSPIKEVEEPGDEGGEGKEEIEDENEEEEFIEEASGESSSAFNDEAIWPAEMIEELSRELKEMKIDFENHEEEEGVIGIDPKHEIANETKRNRDVGNDEEEKAGKVVPVATTETVKLARSRTRVLLPSGFVLLLLLVLLIFRFDAMSRVFHET